MNYFDKNVFFLFIISYIFLLFIVIIIKINNIIIFQFHPHFISKTNNQKLLFNIKLQILYIINYSCLGNTN